MHKKSIAHKYTLLLAGGIVLLAAILIATKPDPELVPRALPPLKVDAIHVMRKDVQPDVLVGGILQPVRRASLQFQVAGRVEARLVEPGHFVKQGDVLLRVEEGDYHDAMVEAKARYQQEQAAVERDRKLLELAERNRALQQEEVARQKRLGSDSLSSRAALDGARQLLMQLLSEEERLRYSVNTAESRLAMAEAAASRAERNWQRTRLSAPFAGVVNRVLPQVGDDVAAKDVVVEMLQVDQLDFYAEVERSVAKRLQMGQQITLDIDGEARTAQIIALQQDADPVTYTYAVRARLQNPGVMPGMAVDARFKLPVLSQAVVIPVSAVVHNDGDSYVYVIDQDKLVRHDIVLGPRLDQEQVVSNGLAGDELIVSRGGGSMSEGQQVAAAIEAR